MDRGVWQATVHEAGRKELDTTEHAHAYKHTHTHTLTHTHKELDTTEHAHAHKHTDTHKEGGRERGGKLLETKRINCLSSLLDLLKHHVTSI